MPLLVGVGSVRGTEREREREREGEEGVGCVCVCRGGQTVEVPLIAPAHVLPSSPGHWCGLLRGRLPLCQLL